MSEFLIIVPNVFAKNTASIRDQMRQILDARFPDHEFRFSLHENADAPERPVVVPIAGPSGDKDKSGLISGHVSEELLLAIQESLNEVGSAQAELRPIQQ